MKQILWSLAMVVMLSGCRKKEEVVVLQPTIESLFETIREEITAMPHYSPQLFVIFFEANQNGIPRALTTHTIHVHRNSCTWDSYYFKEGRWQQSPIKCIDGYMVDPSCYVEACPEQFYILTEEGKEPKLIAFNIVYGMYEWNGHTETVTIAQQAYHITIDPEGYLKAIRMPELEGEWTFDRSYHESNNTEFPIIKLKSPNDTLKPVLVQTFAPKGVGGTTE